MNFLLHRHLAARELDSAVAGVGAMLPDLWRLCERRVRARRRETFDEPLERGVVHHLDTDRWFHESGVFRRGERRLIEAFAPLSVPKLGLFAHATWEMCLDGALVRRVPAMGRSLGVDLARVGSARACTLAEAHGAGALEPLHRERFERGMGRLWELLGDPSAAFIAGYARGDALCARLMRIRARFGLGAPSAEVLGALAKILDEELAIADHELEEILHRKSAA